MKKKTVYLLEAILVLILLLGYTIFVVIPDYKKTQGSSDSFIQSSSYQNMIEVRINSVTDFAFVLNSKGDVYHLFFFDNTSTFLYNENIENHTIQDSLTKVIPILIENNLLRSGDEIELIRDKDDYYQEFIKTWNELLLKYSIETNTLEKVQSLRDKSESLGIDETSTSSILLNMDFYSKEFIKDAKNQSYESLTEETSRKFSNTIYMKLEDLVHSRGITSLEDGDSLIEISLIPAESTHHYYPTHNSWFRVEDGKVFAFIEFEENGSSYSYCYRGSIDLKEKGACSS